MLILSLCKFVSLLQSFTHLATAAPVIIKNVCGIWLKEIWLFPSFEIFEIIVFNSVNCI